MILVTAPRITEVMEVFVKPWAVMKAFMPNVSCTNTVPTAYMPM